MNYTTVSDILATLAGVSAAISAGLKLYSGLRPAAKQTKSRRDETRTPVR